MEHKAAKKREVILLGSDSDKLETLKRYGIPHLVTVTNNTTVIKTATKKYIIGDTILNMRELGFVMQVKRHCEKLTIPKVDVTKDQINYFKFASIMPEGKIFDVCELDVNSAYWELAFLLGYINKKIYDKGLGVSKMCRLISLGAMAAQKHVYEFDGENYIDIDFIKNDRTRSYFFDISKNLSDLMNECSHLIGERGYLFFWVDAFFIKRKHISDVVRFFRNNLLDLKYKDLDYIEIGREKNGERIIKVFEPHNETPRPFPLTTNKSKRNMTTIANALKIISEK